MTSNAEIVRAAAAAHTAVPAFNIPYLPMLQPVVQAVVEQDAVAFVTVARLEWIKFESRSLEAVLAEFNRWQDPAHVRSHLDHIPVIDEEQHRVDYLDILRRAVDAGFHSVMVDGSRLDLDGNIAATRAAVEIAHGAGVACEAELGAVMGHEAGPPPPYEELFRSRLGFTDVEDARRFVRETGCDWLSVAFGNVHGAVSSALKDRQKVEARLDLEHLDRLRRATGVPLVLHGGSGVRQEYLLAAVERGIAKVNVATEIRQSYERALDETGSVGRAQDAVRRRTAAVLADYLKVAGKRARLMGA